MLLLLQSGLILRLIPQGVAHGVRLPWAGCLLALQAVRPQKFSSNL